MNTTLSTNFPVALTYDLFPINTEYGIIYAALVLIGLYVLIITEVSTCCNVLYLIFNFVIVKKKIVIKIYYYLCKMLQDLMDNGF